MVDSFRLVRWGGSLWQVRAETEPRTSLRESPLPPSRAALSTEPTLVGARFARRPPRALARTPPERFHQMPSARSHHRLRADMIRQALGGIARAVPGCDEPEAALATNRPRRHEMTSESTQRRGPRASPPEEQATEPCRWKRRSGRE